MHAKTFTSFYQASKKTGTQKKIGSFFLLHGVQVYKSKKTAKAVQQHAY